MKTFDNKTVLVTGGASGLGFCMGKNALNRGAKHLIIWDIDEDQMLFAAEQLSQKGYSVSTQLVDVSNPIEVEGAAKAVLNEHKKIDFLFNNAGVVVGKKFYKHTFQDINRTLDINVKGFMFVTNAFLPSMIEKDSGHIINITSAAGLTPNPGMTVYAASKWAAIGWAESLRVEMKYTYPGIKFLNVMPSYINTGMFAGVKTPLFMPLLDPNLFSERIIRAVELEKVQLKAPFMVKLTLLFRGMLPISMYDFIAGKLFRVYSSMNTFKGKEA